MAESESGDNNKIVKVEHEDETEESDEDEYIVQNVVPHDNQVSGLHGDKSIQYGDVTIQNSSEVYLGNIYTAPITVVNHVNPVSPTTVPERLEFQGGSVERFTEGSFLKGDQALLKKRKKAIRIAIGIGCAIILIIVATFLGIYYRSQAYDDISEEPTEVPEDWFVTRKLWLADDPTESYNLSHPVPYVIMHHTASEECCSLKKCTELFKYIQRDHMSLQYGDIAYNFMIGGDARVYEGTGWNRIGTHSFRYNNVSIGVAFTGNFLTTNPNPAQLKVFKMLVEGGVQKTKIGLNYTLIAQCQLPDQDINGSPGMYLYDQIKKLKNWYPKPHMCFSNIQRTFVRNCCS